MRAEWLCRVAERGEQQTTGRAQIEDSDAEDRNASSWQCGRGVVHWVGPFREKAKRNGEEPVRLCRVEGSLFIYWRGFSGAGNAMLPASARHVIRGVCGP